VARVADAIGIEILDKKLDEEPKAKPAPSSGGNSVAPNAAAPQISSNISNFSNSEKAQVLNYA
jgi:hypothetical protein